MEDSEDENFESLQNFSSQMSQQQQSQVPKKVRALADKAAKKAASEMRGKFKASEIALIVAEDCPLIADLNKKFNEKLEQGTKLTIFTYVTNVRGLYRWTHRPSQRGGSCNIDGKDSEIFPYVVLQMNPEEITNKLRMTTDGCKFEGLAAYIDESFLKIKSSDRCPQGTRMTILVIGLDKYLAKLPPKSEVSAFCRVPISQLFDNALAFLLCELGIEFVSLKNASEAADYLHGVTRCLMSEPYRRLDQELDCAERFSKKMKTVEGSADTVIKEHLSHITWVNTLRSIHGVSEQIANRIAAAYKSPKDLIDTLNDQRVPVNERQNFLQSTLGTGKGRSNHPKLSRRIFRIFTSSEYEMNVNSDDDKNPED